LLVSKVICASKNTNVVRWRTYFVARVSCVQGNWKHALRKSILPFLYNLSWLFQALL